MQKVEKEEKHVKKDDFENRHYQNEIFEQIKHQNAILFLPTGSGKTYIALQLIKYMQNDLKKSISDNGKRTIFLVNTVALVYQHYEYLSRHCSLTVTPLTGSAGVDLWTIQNWKEVEEKSQVLIMTSQIYLNSLTYGYWNLKNANLIIFDECHHAVSKHPMKEVMSHFQKVDPQHHPKILGLSATLLNANTTSLQFPNDVKELEKTFLAKIITSSRIEEVKRFSTKPDEILKKFEPFTISKILMSRIYEISAHCHSVINNLKLKDTINANDVKGTLLNDMGENRSKLLNNVLKDLVVHIEQFGLYFCYVGCTQYIVQLYRLLFEKVDDERYTHAILFLINATKMMKILVGLEINQVGDLDSTETIYKTNAHQLKYLIEQLFQLKSDDRCIIFVKRRMTAKILCEIIKMIFKHHKDCQLEIDFIIGDSVHPLRNSREGIFKNRCHKQIMNRFRLGEINVLVASNVLEEGIDLPDCNSVIMFDQPQTFRSYVQSKGRARKKGSKYHLFIEENNYEKKLTEFKKLEKELEELVRIKNISPESDDDEEETNEEGEMYVTLSGARMCKTAAIPTIYLYCSVLPHDVFTVLTPLWWEERSPGGVICKLQLPMNSAIRDLIVGPVCENKKDAKQEVAFKAVKMLHQIGALSDNLIPHKIPPQVDEEYWFPNWEENVSNEVNDGTKKSIKSTAIKISKYLLNCRPLANNTAYLHVIKIRTEYEIPTVNRRMVCHKALSSSYELGIVTSHPFPMISDFTLFSDLGPVMISIDTNHSTLILNDQEIIGITKFHKILFMKALQIVKPCLFFDVNGSANGYIVVPLIPEGKQFKIAWNVINDSIKINDFIPPCEKERRSWIFDKQHYWGRIITPWYRKLKNDKIQYYVVTKVNTKLTLQSFFDEKEEMTFADYFKKKFDLEPFQPYQPMMEVRPITDHLNCLRPRSITSGKKNKQNNSSSYLAPEFCLQEIFPLSYWYKGTLLPSILHRLQYLLLAEELREKIVNEAGIGTLHLTKGADDVLHFIEEKKVSQTTLELNKKEILNRFNQRYQYRELKKRKPTSLSSNDEGNIVDIEHVSNPSIADIKNYVDFIRDSALETNENDNNESSFMNKLSASIGIRKEYIICFEKAPILSTIQVHENYCGPRQHQILEAITPKCCADIVNLERLETLGDSFLKFAVSFTVFIKYPNANEGHLTMLKSRLIGNRNLLYCGQKFKLGSYLKMVPFSAYYSWCPPCFTIPERLKSIRDMTSAAAIFHLNIPFVEQYSGQISQQTVNNMKEGVLNFINLKADSPETKLDENAALVFLDQQYVQDKTVSDTVEALIGVYTLTGGIKPAFQLLKFFGILANQTYEDIMDYESPSPRLPKSKQTVEELLPYYEKIENLLQYEFKDKAYLVQALSHPSFIKNTMTNCYQTLEFIGDAVLDFLITSYIYEFCGNLPPGKLTDLRSSLVNNNTFGALAVRLGLQKYLLGISKKLFDVINNFTNYQEQNNYEIHGNELMIMISEEDVLVAEEVEIPKALGDIFESMAGAIFLDSGNNLETVWHIYYNIMKKEIAKFSENIPINPVRALYEQPGLKVKFLKEINDSTEDETLKKYVFDQIVVPLRVSKHHKEYYFYGRGKNVSSCKRAAAKLALKKLGYSDFVI